MALAHPTSTDGITPDYINLLLATANPSASVTAVRILDAKTYGEQMVSTAGRVAIEVDYATGSPADIPTRLVIKLTRAIDEVMAPFYANEVAFYLNIRPELTIEAPRCFGGDFNAESTHFGLLLEDLTERGATFPNTTQRTAPDRTISACCSTNWQVFTPASGIHRVSRAISSGSRPISRARSRI